MNGEQTKMIEEFNEAIKNVETYAKSLKWCYNFFDEDDVADAIQDARDALYFSIMDLKEVVDRASEVGVEPHLLIINRLNIEDDMLRRVLNSSK